MKASDFPTSRVLDFSFGVLSSLAVSEAREFRNAATVDYTDSHAAFQGVEISDGSVCLYVYFCDDDAPGTWMVHAVDEDGEVVADPQPMPAELSAWPHFIACAIRGCFA